MLELAHLTKRYAGIAALNDVSFCLRPGEVTGYLGPNGSGKSTTLKLIAGLIDPSEGAILFDGEPIHRAPLTHKQRLGYVPEDPQIYTHLSGAEYLEMVGSLRGLPEGPLAEKIDGFLRLFSLHEDRHVLISSYSKGMRQKVLLAAALLHNPQVLLLDEPFSGLDIHSALTLRDLLGEVADRGKIVLFSSHELQTLEQVCARVVILHQGRVVADDSVRRLRSVMSAASLEEVFVELAGRQHTGSDAREMARLMEL